MVAHKILCKKYGENLPTAATPIRPYTEADEPLLSEKATFCMSFDNDMLVSGNLYEVWNVELPEWLSPEEWCTDQVDWKYTWGMGVEKTWCEAWQRGLARLNCEERYACAGLLKTKTFRSTFRKSLRDQLVAWLETAPENRKYNNPFSAKQWDALLNVYVMRDAKRLSESLYRAR